MTDNYFRVPAPAGVSLPGGRGDHRDVHGGRDRHPGAIHSGQDGRHGWPAWIGAALAAGEARLTGTWGGIRYPDLPVIRYRGRCLNTLQAAYADLGDDVRAAPEDQTADDLFTIDPRRCRQSDGRAVHGHGRAVEDAEYGLVSCLGTVNYDRGLCTGAAILKRGSAG